MMSSIPENVQALIQGDYLKEALDEYLRFAANIDNGELKKRLIYLQGQLVEVENKFSLGLISYNEYDIKKNKIRLGILEGKEASYNSAFAHEMIVRQVIGVLSLTIVMAGGHWSGLIWVQYLSMILLSAMGVTAFYSTYPTAERLKEIATAVIVILLIAIFLFRPF